MSAMTAGETPMRRPAEATTPGNPTLLSLPSLRAQARIVSGGPVTVEVDGELDLATADRFGDFLAGVAAGLSPRLVLDLSQLAFCDPYGLSALVRAADRAEAVGEGVTLVGVRPMLARLLHVTRLERRFPVRDGVRKV